METSTNPIKFDSFAEYKNYDQNVEILAAEIEISDNYDQIINILYRLINNKIPKQQDLPLFGSIELLSYFVIIYHDVFQSLRCEELISEVMKAYPHASMIYHNTALIQKYPECFTDNAFSEINEHLTCNDDTWIIEKTRELILNNIDNIDGGTMVEFIDRILNGIEEEELLDYVIKLSDPDSIENLINEHFDDYDRNVFFFIADDAFKDLLKFNYLRELCINADLSDFVNDAISYVSEQLPEVFVELQKSPEFNHLRDWEDVTFPTNEEEEYKPEDKMEEDTHNVTP